MERCKHLLPESIVCIKAMTIYRSRLISVDMGESLPSAAEKEKAVYGENEEAEVFFCGLQRGRLMCTGFEKLVSETSK